MSEKGNSRVNNVRLVRLPNGKLVTQAEAEALGMRPLGQPRPVPVSSAKSLQHQKKEASKKATLKQRVDKYFATLRNKKKTDSNPQEKKVQTKYPIAKPIKTTKSGDATKVEISLSLPKLKKPTKKQLTIGAAIVCILFVGFVGKNILQSKSKKQNNGVLSDTTTRTQKIETHQKPEFKVLLPTGKTEETVGGFAKVSPPNSAPAYAFVDEIDGTRIRLTQQQVPDAFKTNSVAELEKTAKNFNATQKIEIDKTTAYIGKSAKGPQTLIFMKDNLLIFVTAEKELPQLSWVQYIAGLK